MARNPKGHIELEPHQEHTRILADETVIAASDNALALHEKGYPVRLYIPREDVHMERLVLSDRVTHCPFKGDATYYHVETAGNRLENAAWSYESPYTAMRDLSGRLVFDHPALTEAPSPNQANGRNRDTGSQ